MKRIITTIDRYVINQYIKVFLFLLIFFFILRLMVLIFEDLNTCVSYGASPQEAIAYFLYSSPAMLSESIPVVMLISAIFVFHRLGKHGEISGIMGAGASFIRITIPIMAAGFLMSIALFFWDEGFSARMLAQSHSIMRYDIKKDQTTRIRQGGVWMRGMSGRFFYIEIVDFDNSMLYNVKVFQVDQEHKNLINLINSEKAIITGDEWLLQKGISTIIDATNVQSYEFVNHTFPFAENMKDLEDTQKSPDMMSFSELKRYLHLMHSSGIRSNRYLTELYTKTSFPLSALIMSVWGIILCMKVREGMTIELSSAILCLVLFYGSIAFFQGLGYKGIIGPWLAAWFTNFLFMGAAVIGLLRRYTY